jgi:hypothetical protein
MCRAHRTASPRVIGEDQAFPAFLDEADWRVLAPCALCPHISCCRRGFQSQDFKKERVGAADLCNHDRRGLYSLALRDHGAPGIRNG